MNRFLVALALSAATANPVLAAPRVLELELLKRGDAPETTDCTKAPVVAISSRVVESARVTVRHNCSTHEASLAIQTGDGSFVGHGVTTQYTGNESEFSLLREDLRVGKLADGETAVIHSVEILRTLPVRVRFGHVQVCSISRQIACTGWLFYECADAECVAPTLSWGRLTTADLQRGAKQFLIGPPSEPEQIE